jgi:hypothetical protein
MPLVLVVLPFVLLVAYFALRQVPAGVPIVFDDAPVPQPGADFAAPETGAGTLAAGELVQSVAPTLTVFESFSQLVDTISRKTFALPARATAYADTISAAEARYGLPDSLLARVLYQESRYRPDVISGATTSPAGALGIAQFMPATARDLGIDPLNPSQAIDGAGRYLKQLFDQFGDWGKALAAYNWGPGNVAKKGMDAAPAETRAYVAYILNDVQA